MKKQLLTGAFLLVALFSAKAQDSCSNPAELPIGVTSIAEINGEFIEGCWSNSTAEGAVWYTVTAPANGVYRVNTNLSQNDGGDTRISVYTGECDALECWSGADDVYYGGQTDPNNNYLTDFQFPVLEGDTYLIAFDDNWSAEGFDVELSFMEANCTTSSLEEDWSDLSTWYFCWQAIDADGDGNDWSILTDYDFDGDFVADNVAAIFSGTENDNDDYLISSAKNLIGGNDYTVSVVYNGINAVDADDNDLPADESFEVAVFQVVDDQFTLVEAIGAETGVVQTGEFNELLNEATTGEYAFTAEEDGEYYFAIHSSSVAGTGALGVFEINVDGTMGTKAVTADSFTVSPNPANSLVTIANADNMLINAVSVADINGRIVKTASFEGAAQAQVNVSDLANGVYMMTISSDKGSVTKKIVKN